MFKRVLALASISALLLTGCSSGSGSAVNLGAAEFQAKTQESGVVVLDVRTRGEFNEGHIANAINIDVEAGTFLNEISSLDKTKPYAVYCRSGHRPADAVNKMSKAGFTNLFNLNAGIIDWQSAGFPVVTQ